MSWRAAPGPARGIGAATTEAVGAAQAADAGAFTDAVDRLDRLDQAQVRRVMGTVVRGLLEDLHPGGLTGDDLQVVLERCAWTARAWWRGVDPATLGLLLLGAMGIQSEEDGLPPGGVPAHAALLTADLLTARGGPLDPWLERAFREIAYAENDGP